MITFRRDLPALILAVGLVGAGFAHEIPTEVTAHLIVKPAGDRLQLLARVPLGSMRDVEFPALPSGYLDAENMALELPDLATVWIAGFIEIYEAGTRLPPPIVAATRISLPGDKSFASFDQALAHVARPLPPGHENLVTDQVLFDVLLEYPIASDRAAFSMRPGLEHLAARVRTVLRFQTPDGSVRAYQFLEDPGRVALDPSWVQAAWRFVELGFFHILGGPDHLLFLLCLVIPFRCLRPLVLIVTAFTIAHSFTLIISAFDLAPDAIWFPPLIETFIAITVVYMALENIVGVSGIHRRWMIACAFGLIHGFGFSFALRETLQFAGSHLLASLISFNLGVELGQLLVLVLLVPALEFLFRFVIAERIGTVILSALVAHTAWHWMTERADQLSQYNFDWTWLTTAQLADAVRWLMWTVIAVGVLWIVSVRLRRGTDDAT